MAKLTFFYGTMDSGKTTHLLQNNHNYQQNGYHTLIVKPQIDTRDGEFDGWGTIKSRLIDDDVPCLYLDSVEKQQIFNLISKQDCNVVFVDEVQFFTKQDIWTISDICDELDIPVYCYGLLSDSNGNMFDSISTMITVADSTYELKRICSCGRKATMHLRLVNGEVDKNGNSIAVEGKDTIEYRSVCRKCWKSY